MSSRLDVFLLPSLCDPAALTGRAVVVIDVLRATTTIATALAHGAREVIPCESVDEARKKAGLLGDSAILGGERNGLRIEGFDLGNSPQDYNSAAVRGKSIVFTTTNGTRAMQACRGAGRLWLAAFVNFSPVCQQLAKLDDAAIVCAGTYREITREDVLLAGALADDWVRRDPDVELNDQAMLAIDAWRAAARHPGGELLASLLGRSRGGRNLIEIGQEADIELAAQLDRHDVLPELDLAAWRITAG